MKLVYCFITEWKQRIIVRLCYFQFISFNWEHFDCFPINNDNKVDLELDNTDLDENVENEVLIVIIMKTMIFSQTF